MKKHIAKVFAIALSLALLLCLIPGKGNEVLAAGASSANLLADKNYSLEDTDVGADPADWTYVGIAKNNSEVTDTEKSDGSKSLHLNVPQNLTSGHFYIGTPLFDVSGISTLRISVDHLTPVSARVWVQFFTATDTANALESKWWATDATTDWATLTQTYAVPSGAVYAKLLVQQNYGNPGDYYFDNFVVEGAVALACYDNVKRATYVYDALSYNFENGETYSSLSSEGWVYGATATTERTAIELNGTTNHVLKLDNSAVSGVFAVYTPAIDVSGLSQVIASADVLSSASANCFLYFYKADGTQIAAPQGITEWNGLSNIDAWNNGAKNQWHNISITRDVPSDAAYARIMLYKSTSNQAVAYYDNIQLAAPGMITPPSGSENTQPSTSAATQASTSATTQPSTSATTQAAGTTAPQSTAGTTAPAATNPDTGDTTGITAMLVVMILAVTTLVAMVSTKFNFRTRK